MYKLPALGVGGVFIALGMLESSYRILAFPKAAMILLGIGSAIMMVGVALHIADPKTAEQKVAK
jgi:hypothetical protein